MRNVAAPLMFGFVLTACGMQPVYLAAADREVLASLHETPLTFQMPKPDAELAWPRVQAWIAKNSSMPLGVVTDTVIQTGRPTGDNVDAVTKAMYGSAAEGSGVQFGYVVTKTPLDDNTVQISVKCTFSNEYTERDANRNAAVLARYIQTGADAPELVNMCFDRKLAPDCEKRVKALEDKSPTRAPARAAAANSVGAATAAPAATCPATADCGCSNYRKAECGGRCCSWVVGSGCHCR